MLNTTNIPSNRVAIVDDKGLITREWYRWFYNSFNLLGNGSNETSLQDLQIGPINDFSNKEYEDLTPKYKSVSQYEDLIPAIQLGTASSINYSKGTWLPTITASTSNPTITYVTQRGNYIQTGQITQLEGYIGWSNIIGGSGIVRISTPFNFQTDDSSGSVSNMSGITLPSTTVVVGINGTINNSYFTITGLKSGASSVSVAVSDLSTAGYLKFSINYIAL